MTLPDFTPGRFHAINDLFDALADAIVPNSCDVVVIDGALDHERLRRAIAATLERHPVLAGDAPIEIHFHELDHDDPALVDAHLLARWEEPLAALGRPVRFHVTETPGATYFQTIHTHVYADSTACYTLTEQIAAAYAARGHEARRAIAKGPGGAPIATWRERAAHVARAAAKTARDLATPDAGIAVAKKDRPGRRRLSRFVFSPGDTARLRDAARARGCTLHGFFQLAFLRAASEYNGARGVDRSALRVWDFFSLRPMLEEKSPRYDCLALVYPVDLDARWSDGDVLANCTETVARMRAGELATHAHRIDALMRATPRKLFDRAWRALFKSNVFLTNPGVCPSRLERFGDRAVIDYVTYPQLFVPADLMFVFSTFRDRLRVLVVHDEDAFDGAIHGDLLAPFLRRLGALGGIDLARAKADEGFVARWNGGVAAREQGAMKHSA